MSSFSQLPWIPSADQFLRAMIAGGERGVQLERLRQSDRPRGGGGMGGIVMRPSAPQPAVARSEGFGSGPSYAVADDTAKLDAQAMAEYEARIRSPRFVTGAQNQNPDSKESLQREIFGIEPPKPDLQAVTFGSGGLGTFNKGTGAFNVVREPSEKAAPEARISTVDTTGMTPDEMAMARLFNAPRVSGTAGTVNSYLSGTNQPTASGGYKIGTVYNGLRYLGGDPNNESSWEKK